MSDAEKIKKLAGALRQINKLLFAKGAPLGSINYFEIRGTAVNALKDCGEEV
jgi:hypothetical protein